MAWLDPGEASNASFLINYSRTNNGGLSGFFLGASMNIFKKMKEPFFMLKMIKKQRIIFILKLAVFPFHWAIVDLDMMKMKINYQKSNGSLLSNPDTDGKTLHTNGID